MQSEERTSVKKMHVASSSRVAAALTCLLLLSLLAGLTEVVRADEWNELYPPNSPGARYGHTMVNLNGKLYVFGGDDGDGNLYNDLWKFENNDWEGIIPENAPPSGRRDHKAWCHDGKMLVFGGAGAGGACCNDMWNYDPNTNLWTEITYNNPPPEARKGHSMGGYKGEGIDFVYIYGGENQAGNSLMDTWTFNFQTLLWTQLTPAHAPSAYQTSALFDYTEWFFYGGKRWNPTDIRNDVRKIIPPDGSGQYVYTTGADPGKRAHHCSAQTDRRWYNFGGAGSTLADCYVFDANDNSWTQCSDMPIPLQDAAAEVFEGGSVHILVFGGLQSDGNVSGRTFEYIPDGGEAAHPQQAPEFSMIGLLALIGAVSVALAVTTSRRRN